MSRYSTDDISYAMEHYGAWHTDNYISIFGGHSWNEMEFDHYILVIKDLTICNVELLTAWKIAPHPNHSDTSYDCQVGMTGMT